MNAMVGGKREKGDVGRIINAQIPTLTVVDQLMHTGLLRTDIPEWIGTPGPILTGCTGVKGESLCGIIIRKDIIICRGNSLLTSRSIIGGNRAKGDVGGNETTRLTTEASTVERGPLL